ncbi:hypothetical protein [Aestuariivivens insulae]|uniref:hypothetical protein n=1 Tax=Aestuariivivens insulae TaxID=1621988 RepID=UPI001F57AC7F|nr:hypothetical protein [Aestuariivivens insulae]
MALTGKHTFGSIDDTRVTFVEKGVSAERKTFLKKLLEHNGFEVLIQEDKRKTEEDPQRYTVAVTDMVFNPTIWVFQRKLETFDGQKVTRGYWEQETEDAKPQYWNNGSSNPK